MCKHVAAVLYGVGARLDTQPELLFTLRQVDANDLVSQAVELSVKTRKTPARAKLLDDSQLADVFGIEMDSPAAGLPDTKKKAGTRQTKPTKPLTVATKTPARATTNKKTVTVKTAKDPQARKERMQTQAGTAVARKSTHSSNGKRAARQIAPNTVAQIKKGKAQT